jgi:hypothetical protein
MYILSSLILLVNEFVCLNIAVSLANALNCASALEAKLKANTKALGEADKKCAKEVAATEFATDQAVKEAEARAIKAEKSLAEVLKRQTQCEEVVVKRINDLLTSIGSKCSLPVDLYCLLCFVDLCFY